MYAMFHEEMHFKFYMKPVRHGYELRESEIATNCKDKRFELKTIPAASNVRINLFFDNKIKFKQIFSETVARFDHLTARDNYFQEKDYEAEEDVDSGTLITKSPSTYTVDEASKLWMAAQCACFGRMLKHNIAHDDEKSPTLIRLSGGAYDAIGPILRVVPLHAIDRTYDVGTMYYIHSTGSAVGIKIR